MDNQRLFLFAGLGFILLIIWQQWQIDYAPAVQEVTQTTQKNGANPLSANNMKSGDMPEAASVNTGSKATAGTPNVVDETLESESLLHVSTDTINVVISSTGGNILGVKLKKYPVSIKQPDRPFLLMSDAAETFFIAQSGLQSAKGSPVPTHHSAYQVSGSEYQLETGQSELRVPMYWREKGVEITKTFVFRAGSHVIDIEYAIDNKSGNEWVGNQYRQLQRKGVTDEGGSIFGVRAYIGGVISSAENRYEKIDFEDMLETDLRRKITGGWAAIIQHYFLAAWAPSSDEQNTYYTRALVANNRYILGLYSNALNIPAGGSGRFNSTLYVGPKVQDDLAAVAENLNLTVDYGFLSIIAEPLFVFLKWIHGYIGNWGWAILIVTLAIKLLFYKLSEISYRSMARMRKLQPQLQALKDRHGDDRTKMGQATMALYKKEKVNPLGGCLPVLVQIPVFIALYWVLLESVELRQAPFILWIKDLAIKDPYFVLPLIMGATMLIQQRLNPAPVDPIQAKIFMVMPFVFTVFFAFFPAGLVLYWVANNTLSLAQQYYITRHILAEGSKK